MPEEQPPLFSNLPSIDREPRFATTVVSTQEVAPEVVVLTLDRPAGFSYSPGQYVWLVLPQRTKLAGVIDRRAYSLSSDVRSERLEIFLRITGSEYTLAVQQLRVGSAVELIGPMGSTFVPPRQGAILIAGGVGISPFLSILRSQVLGRFSLFAFDSATRPLHYTEELQRLAEAGKMEFSYKQEQVSAKHFRKLPTSGDQRPIFISGPQGFVDAVTQILKTKGIDQQRLRFEANYPRTKESIETAKVFEHISDVGKVESLTHPVVLAPSQESNIFKERLWTKERILGWLIGLVMVAAAVSAVELLAQAEAFPKVHLFIFASFSVLAIWRWRGGKVEVISEALVGVVFVALLYSRIDPAFTKLLEPWLLAFPVITRKLSSFRHAIWWNLFFILLLIFISVLGGQGRFGIPEFDDSLFQYVLTIIFISVLTGVYSLREERQQKDIERIEKERERLIGKMLEALKLSEVFVKVSSQTSNHVVLTDKDGRVLYANKAAERLTGYTFPEMRGQTPRLWGGLMPPAEYQRIWNLKSRGIQVTHQIINRRRSGKLYVALGRITPILQDSKVVAYVATEEDVTSIVNLDKTKTEFVSLASHQLRTPLSAINWYTEMLMNGDAGKINDEQKEYLHEVYTGSQRMVELVNALLNVSRIDMGTFAVEPQPTNIVDLAKRVQKDIQRDITVKQQRFSINVDGVIPEMNLDPKLLGIVFQNLFTNAVKYTPEKGEITVHLWKKAKNLCIDVADTGYGIPKAQQEKIFTKLFRADNVREKVTDGTGLGLYIVKAIVLQSNGSITFTSEEGKGTTFHVILPLTGMQPKAGTKGLTA